MKSMSLEIAGIIALILGVWLISYCWWFIAEVILALLAVGLIVGGGLMLIIAFRRKSRAKAKSAESE